VVVTQICGAASRAPETDEEVATEQEALATWMPVLERRLARQADLRDAQRAEGEPARTGP
jgi:hypothetical protein